MADTIDLTQVKLDFCTQLRTKRSYISDDPPATYLTEDVSETGYWCVRTMGVIGPDDGYVCASNCGANRSCYKSSLAKSV
jgi:hypothetical protein